MKVLTISKSEGAIKVKFTNQSGDIESKLGETLISPGSTSIDKFQMMFNTPTGDQEAELLLDGATALNTPVHVILSGVELNTLYPISHKIIKRFSVQ